MRKGTLQSAHQIFRWLLILTTSLAVFDTLPGLPRAEGGVVLAQISGTPSGSGGSKPSGSDPTFRQAMMIVVCLALIFILSLFFYLAIFQWLLGSYWPRTAYAVVSALFWISATGVVLAMFWAQLKYRFTAGEGWHNEHGVRALVIAQGIVIASLFLFTKRSEGPFPVLVRDRVKGK